MYTSNEYLRGQRWSQPRSGYLPYWRIHSRLHRGIGRFCRSCVQRIQHQWPNQIVIATFNNKLGNSDGNVEWIIWFPNLTNLGFAHFLVQCHVGTTHHTGRGKGSGKCQHNEDDKSTEHLLLYEKQYVICGNIVSKWWCDTRLRGMICA